MNPAETQRNFGFEAPAAIQETARRALRTTAATALALGVGWLVASAAPAALAFGSEWLTRAADLGRVVDPAQVAPQIERLPARSIPLEWRGSRPGAHSERMFRKGYRGY
jgi:hypothetical protein